MIPKTEIKIEVDEHAIREYIESQLEKKINQHLLFLDINRLVQITNMSKRFLEDEILVDARVRIHERRKNRKRWWVAEPTLKAIEAIVSEW